ncbi:acyl-CoA thioesterase [Lachnospiraceae bacterium C1.1]|nr:acyl-CoA thioesterase [Lachnospiraceae bacterium C1.1]
MEIKPYGRKVFYYETDRMGIVHHSNYIRWFEEARIEFMKQIGVPYDLLEEKGIIIPVLSVSAVYRKHMTYGDEFSIQVHDKKFNGIKAFFEYEVFNQNGELCATGESSHCMLDKDLKPFRFKKEYPEIYKIFAEAAEEGPKA